MYREPVKNLYPTSFALYNAKGFLYKYRYIFFQLFFLFSFAAVLAQLALRELNSFDEFRLLLVPFFGYGAVIFLNLSVLFHLLREIEESWLMLKDAKSDHLVFSEKHIEFKASVIKDWNQLSRDEIKFDIVLCRLSDLEKIRIVREWHISSCVHFVFKDREIVVKTQSRGIFRQLIEYLEPVFKDRLEYQN